VTQDVFARGILDWIRGAIVTIARRRASETRREPAPEVSERRQLLAARPKII
jgi:hypothetical protein